jgi:hypothetical protein
LIDALNAVMAGCNDTAEKLEARVSLNRKGRETYQTKGVALNECGSFVGRQNVLRSECDWLAANVEAIKTALLDADSETVWHLTRGEIGVHAGRAQLTRGVKIGERTVDVLQKPDGSIYTENVSSGFSVLTDRTLLALAKQEKNLQRIKILRRVEGGWQDDTVLSGTVIGALGEARKQVLVHRTESGLDVRCITTSACASHEQFQAVLLGAVQGKDAATLQTLIFSGVEAERAKTAKQNEVKAKRRAAKAAKK